MLVGRFFHHRRRNYLLGSSVLLIVSLFSVAFSLTSNDDFETARREVLLRRIGHEVLLRSGDSLSRVLPVKRISANEYRISFEKAFTFQPGVLVSTTQHVLAQDPDGSDFVVNVVNCADGSVTYAFAISEKGKDDIVSCLGRTQPQACYRINVRFKPASMVRSKGGYFFGALFLLAFVGVIYWKPAKPQIMDAAEQPVGRPAGMFTLGTMSFDVEARKLTGKGSSIDLTRTESRVLNIFAMAPNQVIERSRLQKEIWEDQGVIVGRSLDVFISKLRKKLEVDPHVKIAVIRGKGYRLETNA